MAEQVPYAVAASTITRLASSAFSEIGLIYGLKNELEKLKDTIESTRAVLLDAEEKQEKSHAVKNWIGRLKQVLHDADHLVDDFETQELLHKVGAGRENLVAKVHNFFSSSNQIIFNDRMAHKIKKVLERFNDVAGDVVKLNFIERAEVKHSQNEEETSSFVLESDIIGRDESKREIIDSLFQVQLNQNVSLVVIAGIGGLGKTALAQLVYNDKEVMRFFKKQMWVCVSDNFEVKSIVRKILESLTGLDIHGLELETMQKKLRESISRQRYLLVLDDVWNENHKKWDHLRNFLMCGAQGSKILVTTRNEIVAKTMGVNTPYVLKGLTKEQSWTLFEKRAFREGSRRISPYLESIGEKIVQKCRGVPLAIRAIGSLLQSKTEESEWLSVLEGAFWRLPQGNHNIMPVLKFSYDNLPIHLRQCFTYCSLFPKDFTIIKNDLIQLWMAQGYLECSDEMQCKEDVGNQYVNVLLMRSFFHDVEVDEYGDVKCFKMHDLMHDLAQSIAGADCYIHTEGKRIAGKPLHISFMCNAISLLDSACTDKLRTFIWVPQAIDKPDVILKLRCLHVLDLSRSSITRLPKSIHKLKHLRYLDLSYCENLISLPKTINYLVNLQTLKLEFCWRLGFYPKGITKLINLRCLVIDACEAFEGGMPAGLGNLTSLQNLSHFAVVKEGLEGSYGKLNELKDLNDLRGHLSIQNLGGIREVDIESEEVNLKGKKSLRSLHLNWGDYSANKYSGSLQLLDNLHPHNNLKGLEVLNYPGVTFSSWLSSLTNLVELTLSNFSNCNHLPQLEHLPYLKSLSIRNMNALQFIDYGRHEETLPSASSSCDVATAMFFPSLEKLNIVSCKKLSGWQSMHQQRQQDLLLPPFPCLSDLRIWHCPNMTFMPMYPRLIELDLVSCSLLPLINTVNMNNQVSDSLCSSSFTPLSKLKSLTIGESDIGALPQHWMQKFTSLERLDVYKLPITSLLQQLHHLPAALQNFRLNGVENLENVGIQCLSLHSLHGLQKICISGCDNLKALPEWICNFPSLMCISIEFCSNLVSLPEEMNGLTNLQTLYITSCDLLNKRCKRGEGSEWHKIAHIPKIIIDGMRI